MHVRSAMHLQDDNVSIASSLSGFGKVPPHETFGKKLKQKTILFTKEVVDTDNDYLNMEIKEFVKLGEEELAIAFNRLQKMVQPVFSGALDTLINKIDPHKAVDDDYKTPAHKKKVNYKRKSDLNDIESTLLDE